MMHGRAERRAAETAPRAQIQSKRRHEEPRPRGNSLITKFGLLVIAFVALPVVVYQEFEQAYQEKQRLLLESVREQGRLMASNLRPLLLRDDSTPFVELPERLPELATDEMGVRVLLSPKDETGVESFYFVASAPTMAPAALERERALLVDSGILDQLVESCTGDLALAVRHQSSDGQDEMLTSITPVTTETGCWAIIGTHVKDGFLGTSIGQPYWQTWEVRLAIVTYALLTVLVMGMFFTIWRNINSFGNQARMIRTGRAAPGSFARTNRVPELEMVAEEFDRMTHSLVDSAESMRRAAEDNAHAFKTPIAIMRQSLEPLRRIVPEEHTRGRRAIDLIEQAIDRLDHLVSSARQLEENAAELLDPPREPINLSRLVERMMNSYEDSFAAQGVGFFGTLQPNVVVRGGEDLLETVVENILDNALGLCHKGDEVSIELTALASEAIVTVRDSGPGVPPGQLDHIFERYVSFRPTPARRISPVPEGSSHAGIGLWIVRRNLEAIGGRVFAQNNPERGLTITMRIPKA